MILIYFMNLNKVLLSAATVVGFTAATVATANADTVTVNAGDTLSHIALRNNTTVEALQQLNNLENINETAAREWIAGKESGGSYTVTNGQYIGKYQLSASYLNGDYSAENQERVANNYVSSRYGSWTNAKQHWLQNGWY